MNMNNKSFTLIELLVVIVIIGILAGVIMISTSSSIDKANIAKLKVFEESVKNELMIDLISEWKFDDDVSDSWGSNHAINNGVTFSNESQCISKQCGVFNGLSSYVSILHNSSFKPTDAITFGGWAYSKNWADVSEQRLLSCTEGAGYQFGFNDTVSNRIVYVRRNESYGIITYNLNVLENGWHYFLATYDGRYLKAYIDANQVGNTNDAGGIYPIQYINNSLMIGAEASGGTNVVGGYFDGMIDSVRIYGSALLSVQIKQNYIAGLDSLLSKGSISKEDYNKRIENLSNVF